MKRFYAVQSLSELQAKVQFLDILDVVSMVLAIWTQLHSFSYFLTLVLFEIELKSIVDAAKADEYASKTMVYYTLMHVSDILHFFLFIYYLI